MNAEDVLKYGHLTVMEAIEGLTEEQVSVGGVCGYWSVRDILAHLASHEHVLVDVLASFLGETSTPTFERYLAQGFAFNDAEVEKRKSMSYADVVREYRAAHDELMGCIRQIPAAKRQELGTLPWYGMEYDLEDLIAYSNYGHKREHTAQINVYTDSLR